MKSVSFLRNTWKKWESKSSDGRGNAENVNPQERQKPSPPRSTKRNERSLTITVVKHIPLDSLDAPKTVAIDGSWRPSEYRQPPSPIYDQFTQNRGDLSFMRRHNSQITLDTMTGDAERGLTSPIRPLRHATSNIVSRPSAPAQATVAYRSPEHSPSSPRHPSSPCKPTVSLRTTPPPTFHLLPPIDLDYGPGSKFERSLEASICKCLRSSPQSRHHSQCPRYSSSGGITIARSREVLDGRNSEKSVHAVLNKSLNSSPRSLYRRTGSTPHLPFIERSPRPSPTPTLSEYSCSETSEDHFPLSLFPAPPPLIVRKKIPAPLVLRPIRASSSQSSLDSTPIGTPTTPRNQSAYSPSQSSITSPNKKHFSLRQCASFSPPPFSPPNSPLPNPPSSPERSRWPSDSRRSPEYHGRPLRHAQSNANLRDALPFPATHRLTSSEPISDQSSLPIQIPSAKGRPEAIRGVRDLQGYMVR